MRIKFIQKFIDKIRNKKQKENILTYEDSMNIIETVLYYIPNSQVLRPNIVSSVDTIKELQNSSKSIARFGDGEMLIINKNDIAFEKYSPELGQKLSDILKNNQANLMVGINQHHFFPPPLF